MPAWRRKSKTIGANENNAPRKKKKMTGRIHGRSGQGTTDREHQGATG